ncbi:MAG: NfeD family protein [Prochlorotrichaceae cyanobacterium]|jgi:membrane protein implicated in regulation of membrane protease activity
MPVVLFSHLTHLAQNLLEEQLFSQTPLIQLPVAQISPVETLPRFYPSPPFVWLFIGTGFCALELYFHTKLRHGFQYILLMMGVAAIAEGLILWRMTHTMGLIWFYIMQQDGAASLQILYWMGLAFTGIIWVRPMFHFKKRSAIPQDSSGETITAIEPGKMGRVLYEGCSWQACCENYHQAIPPQHKVFILRREGNLLFIAPEDLFH